MIKRTLRHFLRYYVLAAFDAVYLAVDKRLARRSRQIQMIPNIRHRFGGKIAYSEWAHSIGIFQTLMFAHLPDYRDAEILDVGCGSGLLGIASLPFVNGGSHYTGIEVQESLVDFCRYHFPSDSYLFHHLSANNPFYASEQEGRAQWPVDDASIDLLTALSVWTHFDEDDAIFYLKEVQRVLKPGGRAIITFFILDEAYNQGVDSRQDRPSAYHGLSARKWIFDTPAYGSEQWFYPRWAETPEEAIGVTSAGLDRLLAESKLRLLEMKPGNWREAPGVFFQDVMVFEKPAS